MLFLAACGRRATSGQPKIPTGFFYGNLYKYLGHPMQNLLEWFAGLIGGPSGYGIAILLFTIVVRLVLMPSMINQQKNMTEQQEKARILQPQLKLLQAAGKVANGQQEQLQINGLMQDVYKKNGSSMMPKMGCIALLIQLPIFSSLYQAVAYSPDIYKASFFGIQLGKPSMIVTIIATALYFLQGYMSLMSATPDQRKTMRSMIIFSPMMTFFISMASSAGLGLYFLGGGIMMVVQQVIISYIIIPNIRKRLDAEYDKKPPVVVVDESMFDEDGRINDKAPAPSSLSQFAGMAAEAEEGNPDERKAKPRDVTSSTSTTEEDLRKRNAGKQQRPKN